MKHIKIVLFALVPLLLAGPAAAQFTDTENENDTDTNDTYSDDDFNVEIYSRDDNPLGISHREEFINNFSSHDCNADVGFSLRVELMNDAEGRSGDRLYLYAGDEADCDTGDRPSDSFSLSGCLFLENITIGNTGSVTFPDILLSRLFPDATCDDDTNHNIDLWVGILSSKGTVEPTNDDLWQLAMNIVLDTAPPAATVETTGVTLGDGNIEVEWDAVDNSDVTAYIAFYQESATGDCSDTTLVGGVQPDAANVDGNEANYNNSEATSIRITGLTNGTYYQVAVSTLDDAGNTSVLSNPQCVAPAETVGFGEALETDGGYCFIATAAFGSYDHPQVKRLRAFRDLFLREAPGGNAFIDAYYQAGPKLAQLVHEHPFLKKTTVGALSLFAGFSTFLVAVGPSWILAALIISILLGVALGVTVPVSRRTK